MDISLQAKLLGALENRDVRKGNKGLKMMSWWWLPPTETLPNCSKRASSGPTFFTGSICSVLRVPSLRERKEDIPLLADYFLSQYKNEFGRKAMRLSPPAIEVLLRYDWPGNVRELKNLLGKICLLEDADVIKPEHLLDRLPKPQEEALSLPVPAAPWATSRGT